MFRRTEFGGMVLIVLGLGLMGCQFRLKPATDPFYGGILQENPDQALALYAQGQAYLRQGLFQDAAPYFQRLTRVAPQKRGGWIGLGQCMLELREPREAERAFREALRLKNEPKGRFGLISALILEGQTEEVRREIASAEQAWGSSLALDRVKGDLAFAEGKTQEAIESYRKSLAQDPSQARLRERIGDLEDFLTSNR